MKIIEFARLLGKLKKLKRTGWVMRHIPEPESVAEHTYRVATLAMFLASHVGVNQERAIKMALIHDLAEAEVGDVIKYRGKDALPNLTEKLHRERRALTHILALIDAVEYVDLFDEYVANQTPEAQFVKQLDKLERALQAVEYEKEYQLDAHEFIESARSLIHNKFLKGILNYLEKSRTNP